MNRLPLGRELVVIRGADIETAIATVAQHPAVTYAEPNFVYGVSRTPNDPGFKDLWGLDNQAQSILGIAGLGDADIDAAEAWDVATGSRSIRVGVVDSGVDHTHPDLTTNIWINPGESGAGKDTNGRDDDGNGYVDDWRGWDWVDRDNNPIDLHSHGTHVAGTIGAGGSNGAGITGVNWNVGLVPLRVLGANGSGTTADISAAFAYAGALRVEVVNASLGGGGMSQTLADTIARYPETLFVVAAGNNGANNDASPTYPCNYPADNLICVASTTNGDRLSSFSNYGATTVDLGAPGSSVLSTVPSFTDRFLETFETDPADRWTSASAGRWQRGEDGGGFFLADTAAGGFTGASDASVVTVSPVDLTGHQGCRLRYDLRLDIAADRDVLRVEASADRQSWQRIAAWAGTTSGKWAGMNDDLATFDGSSSVFLRYRLITSEGSQGGGADIDNVRIRCLSPTPSTNYSFYSGTSMASPHVAGAAALVWSVATDPSAATVKRALLAGADDVPDLAGKTVTGGRLNVNSAMRGVGADSARSASPSPIATASERAPDATTEPPVAPTRTVAPSPSLSSAQPGPNPSPSGEQPNPSPSGSGVAPPTPSPPPPLADEVDRRISLKLRGELVARGRVTTPDGSATCANGVPVTLRRNGIRVAKTITDPQGYYGVRIRTRKVDGRYLATANTITVAEGTRCSKASSNDGRALVYRAADFGAAITPRCPVFTRPEERFLERIALERSARSIGGLRIDRRASRVARDHTRRMIASDAVFNIEPEVARDRLPGWETMIVHVAAGRDANSLHDAFMNSATHRPSILSRESGSIGVGATKVEGRTWATLVLLSGDPANATRSSSCR